MREKGFFYADQTAMQHEFQLAEAYFQQYPDEVKIRREQWRRLYQTNPPKHSYLHFGKKVIALATKENRRDAEHRIGFGAFGAVKYGVDRHGHLYAVKIEKTNNEAQQKETQANLDLGLMADPKIMRTSGTGQEKYYSSLLYLGDSLDKKLRFESPWNLEQKKNIARKIAWQVHQLHSGKLSENGTGYAHFDIKPDNITIDEHGRVRLIDYGFAQSVNTPITELTGSSAYWPSLHVEQYHTAKQEGDQSTADHYAQEILQTMQNIGPMGTDLFACKRSLYMADPDKSADACLFSDAEYQQLSPELHDMLQTGGPQAEHEFHHALQQKTSALDIAYGFSAEKLSPALRQQIQSSEDRAAVCELFALLDQLEEWDGMPTPFKQDLVSRYEERIAAAQSLTTIARVHQELEELTQCLSLLTQIATYRVGYTDRAMQDFIDEHARKLYSGDFADPKMKQTLSAALQAVQSDEMMYVQARLAKWTQQMQRPTRFQALLGSPKRLQAKINTVESAVHTVPLLERKHILTNKDQRACRTVQSYCKDQYLKNTRKQAREGAKPIPKESLRDRYKSRLRSSEKTIVGHGSEHFRPH